MSKGYHKPFGKKYDDKTELSLNQTSDINQV